MLVLWHDDQKSRPSKTASVECLQALQNLNRSCRVQVSSDTAIYQVGAAIKKPLFQLIIHVGGSCRKLQLLTSNNLSLEVYSGNIHSRAQCWESQWKTYIHDQCRAAPAIWLSQALFSCVTPLRSRTCLSWTCLAETWVWYVPLGADHSCYVFSSCHLLLLQHLQQAFRLWVSPRSMKLVLKAYRVMGGINFWFGAWFENKIMQFAGPWVVTSLCIGSHLMAWKCHVLMPALVAIAWSSMSVTGTMSPTPSGEWKHLGSV